MLLEVFLRLQHTALRVSLLQILDHTQFWRIGMALSSLDWNVSKSSGDGVWQSSSKKFEGNKCMFFSSVPRHNCDELWRYWVLKQTHFLSKVWKTNWCVGLYSICKVWVTLSDLLFQHSADYLRKDINSFLMLGKYSH